MKNATLCSLVFILALVLSGCGKKPIDSNIEELSGRQGGFRVGAPSTESPVPPAPAVPAPAAPAAVATPTEPIATTSSSTPSLPTEVKVSIKDFSFSPASVTVKAGDKVIWTNNDQAPHAIKIGSESLVTMNTGESSELVFKQTGTFNYSCAIHPSMTGTVVVK